MALTAKQVRFVDEYLIDLNATQAAIRAGYSEKTAYSMGQRLLKNVEVQHAIQEKMATREKRTQISQDKVLQELANVAFVDSTDFAKVVVKSIPVTVVDENGDIKTVMQQNQIVELTATEKLSQEQRAAISGIKETKFGIEVSSYDKVRALELLGRHLGMFTDKVQHSGSVAVNNPFADLSTDELKKLVGDG